MPLFGWLAGASTSQDTLSESGRMAPGRATGMLFVVGNGHSGTILMGRILGRNPRVYIFHELRFFEEQ